MFLRHSTLSIYLLLTPNPECPLSEVVLYIDPLSLPRRYWPVVDDALRRAAYDRGVHVRFLGSFWEHTSPDQVKFLASLAADNPVGRYNGTIQAVSLYYSI